MASSPRATSDEAGSERRSSMFVLRGDRPAPASSKKAKLHAATEAKYFGECIKEALSNHTFGRERHECRRRDRHGQPGVEAQGKEGGERQGADERPPPQHRRRHPP